MCRIAWTCGCLLATVLAGCGGAGSAPAPPVAIHQPAAATAAVPATTDKDGFMTGERVLLHAAEPPVPAATDEEALTRARKLLAERNRAGLDELVATGQLLLLDHGTGGAVTGVTPAAVRVRIENGPHDGRVVLVARENVKRDPQYSAPAGGPIRARR